MNKGTRLKELREAKRLSQTEAARHLGVSKQTLYKYENDIITNIPSDVVEKIATLYETTPAYIMGWEDERGEKTPYKRLLDAYENKGGLEKYSAQEIIRALDFLDALEQVPESTRSAIEILLKSHRSDP